MEITPIELPAVGNTEGLAFARKPAEGFASWMAGELAQTNDLLRQSDQAVNDLAVGRTENLHQVMIALEKAKLSFQLVAQVRNHLLDAYQSVMQMQV